MGQNHSKEDDLPKDAIIIARNMGAAELLDYDRERIRGLVLEESGPTSHVTIVARALGIPTVGQVEDIVSLVEAHDAIIVDGEIGRSSCVLPMMLSRPTRTRFACAPSAKKFTVSCAISQPSPRMERKLSCS